MTKIQNPKQYAYRHRSRSGEAGGMWNSVPLITMDIVPNMFSYRFEHLIFEFRDLFRISKFGFQISWPSNLLQFLNFIQMFLRLFSFIRESRFLMLDLFDYFCRGLVEKLFVV